MFWKISLMNLKIKIQNLKNWNGIMDNEIAEKLSRYTIEKVEI